MSVICEVYQSHEISWRVEGCNPKWNQNDQRTTLHSMTLYPDLDYTKASGTSTYVRYTSADKIRDLQLAIHEVICKKVRGGKEKEETENPAIRTDTATPVPGLPAQEPSNSAEDRPNKESNVKEAAALPPSSNGPGLPATTQKYGAPATTQSPGLPATTQNYGAPATTQNYGVPATTGNNGLPYDASKYVNKDQEQKLLPDKNRPLELPPPSPPEEPREEETKPEEPKPEEKEKKEEVGNCCDYYIKITTNKLRMIEKGSGSSNFKFRYLMSENLLKELGSGEKLANTDKFTISITPASNGFSKLFTSSFSMSLDEFNSTDSNYPGNLIVAIIPTLELEFTGSESLPSEKSTGSYDEVSAKILRKRILALEFDPNNQGLSEEQKEELFRKTINTWEEDTRKDVETLDQDEEKRKREELEKEADEPEASAPPVNTQPNSQTRNQTGSQNTNTQ